MLSSATLHLPFLRRAAEEDDAENAVSAILILRVLDELAAGSKRRPDLLGMAQHALDRVGGSSTGGDERRHLLGLARGLYEAIEQRDVNLVSRPLDLYVGHLLDTSATRSALDVIRSGLRLYANRDSQLLCLLLTRQALPLRRLGRLEHAVRSCQSTIRLARATRYPYGSIRAHNALANVRVYAGDLSGGLRTLRVADMHARRLNMPYATACAEHDIGAVHLHMGQAEQAETGLLTALELYDNPVSRTTVLSDLGSLYVKIGAYDDAEATMLEAFGSVYRSLHGRTCTCAEILKLYIAVGDRSRFDHWRYWGRDHREHFDVEGSIDYALTVGNGLQQFEGGTAARPHLSHALSLAERYRMGRYIFLAEQALDRIN